MGVEIAREPKSVEDHLQDIDGKIACEEERAAEYRKKAVEIKK